MSEIEELRTKLAQKSNEFTEEQIQKMTKKQLQKTIENIESSENILNGAILDEDSSKPVRDKEPGETPEFASTGWTEYVLSVLDSEKELDNGNPRTDGLRRVAHVLLGNFNIETTIFDSPNWNNGFRATIKVSLHFLDSGKKIDGAADVFTGNTDQKFAKYAIATAETRAEGRALRKALLLSKTVTAEEISDVSNDESNGMNGRINLQMLNSLYLMSERAKLDLDKLLQKNGINVDSHQELTEEQGYKIANLISTYQKSADGVPQDLLK